jgi:RNA polymerase sigma-70 factor (ECF subfamily)
LETIDIDLSFEMNDNGLVELENNIKKILETLPDKCRMVFEMSRFKSMKNKEIAVKLDVSIKTVEAHITKALKSLREQLKGYTLLLCLFLEII